MSKGKRISYIGLRSGRLVVIDEKQAPKGSSSYHKMAVCKCDCGNIIEVRGTRIANKTIQSCGCIAIEKHTKRLTKHKMYGTRIYRIWSGMKARCFRKALPEYSRYGGRGITVCKEWKNDFETFHQWAMANGYREDLTIDRINNNGNYEPTNCRWVTSKEQSRNTSKNKLLNYKGETHCASYWAEKLNLNYYTLLTHLRKGMSVKNALEYQRRSA